MQVGVRRSSCTTNRTAAMQETMQETSVPAGRCEPAPAKVPATVASGSILSTNSLCTGCLCVVTGGGGASAFVGELVMA